MSRRVMIDSPAGGGQALMAIGAALALLGMALWLEARAPRRRPLFDEAEIYG